MQTLQRLVPAIVGQRAGDSLRELITVCRCLLRFARSPAADLLLHGFLVLGGHRGRRQLWRNLQAF
jgi:hypothetical protein